jgi:hypothetical protein
MRRQVSVVRPLLERPKPLKAWSTPTTASTRFKTASAPTRRSKSGVGQPSSVVISLAAVFSSARRARYPRKTDKAKAGFAKINLRTFAVLSMVRFRLR